MRADGLLLRTTDDYCEQTGCEQTGDYCEQTGDYFLLILRNTFENENEYD